jgi:alkylated DNA repair dioxygenase AlkB
MTPNESPKVRFKRHELGSGHWIVLGRLDSELVPTAEQFEIIWAMHPENYPEITIRGRKVLLPRWQQAYGHDYAFSDQVAEALEIPLVFGAYLAWCQAAIDSRLNGLLVNWYDGRQRHYIGPHHDEAGELVAGSPIVTLSLGEERLFRLSCRGTRRRAASIAATHDFMIETGSVVIIPWETNLVWKHAVPNFARYTKRRISITVRAFV